MDVEFADEALAKLESDPTYTGGHAPALVKAFRKRMQLIRAAVDERAFRALKSLHFEKLKGNLDGQHSMRLNDQWRLLIRLEERATARMVVIIAIADYH